MVCEEDQREVDTENTVEARLLLRMPERPAVERV
jgi:hypothetical protein